MKSDCSLALWVLFKCFLKFWRTLFTEQTDRQTKISIPWAPVGAKKHLNIWRKYMSWGKWSLVCMFGQILAMFGKYKLIYSPPIWSGWTGERILTSKVNKCKMKESLYHRWLEDYSLKLESKHQTSQKCVVPLYVSPAWYLLSNPTRNKRTRNSFLLSIFRSCRHFLLKIECC